MKKMATVAALIIFSISIGGCSARDTNKKDSSHDLMQYGTEEFVLKNGNLNVEKLRDHGYKTISELSKDGRFGIGKGSVIASDNKTVQKEAIKNVNNIEKYLNKVYEPMIGRKVKVVSLVSSFPDDRTQVFFKTTSGPEMIFEENVSSDINDHDIEYSNSEKTNAAREGVLKGLYYYAYKDTFDEFEKLIKKNSIVDISDGNPTDYTLGGYVMIQDDPGGDGSNKNFSDEEDKLIDEFKNHSNEKPQYWQNYFENSKINVAINVYLNLKDEKKNTDNKIAKEMFNNYSEKLYLPRVTTLFFDVKTALSSYKGRAKNSDSYGRYLNNKNEWVVFE